MATKQDQEINLKATIEISARMLHLLLLIPTIIHHKLEILKRNRDEIYVFHKIVTFIDLGKSIKKDGKKDIGEIGFN